MGDCHGQRREAVAQVLDEGVTAGHNVSRGRLLKATHRLKALFQMSMIALQPVVQELRCAVLHGRQDLTQRWWITRGFIRDDPLRRYAGLLNSPLEEGLGRFGISSPGEVRVDDLTVLIDRPINLGPCPMETDIRFVNAPFSTNALPIGPNEVTHQSRAFRVEWPNA